MSRPNYDDVDYYDCTNKPDGNYVHPHDCTRFITCHAGRAADMACPDCDQNNPACDGSEYLFYNLLQNSCMWPAEIECYTE